MAHKQFIPQRIESESTILTRGKYKNRPARLVAELEPSYLLWMARNGCFVCQSLIKLCRRIEYLGH